MARRQRELTPGYTVVYPNREKATSHTARLIVFGLLLASVGLMLIVTVGGWSKLQGMKPVNLIWAAVYLIIAFYVMRWNRGLLPIAAALGVLLLVLSVIAATGYSGTSWFDRSASGFGTAQTLFGGDGLSADTLGAVTWIIAPVQLGLIVVSMYAFAQGWNVEEEMPIEEARRRAGHRGSPSAPATA